jgi:P pilus assembly chaperone PapD
MKQTLTSVLSNFICAGVCKRVGAFLILTLALTTSNVLAGVLVAPTVVFLSDQSRTGRMTLQNLDDKAQEVTVFFSFGLPTADSLGDVLVRLQDSAVTDPQSCLEWVKAFPRRLILPPNASQVVRFVANPPRELPDGEYWARVVVKAQEANPSIPKSTGENQITTRLNMVMQTAIMLKYRHGNVFCELTLEEASARFADGQVEVLVDTKNIGNASYLGVLNCMVVDADGREVARRDVQLAVYRELRRRVQIPIPEGDFTRPYKVNLEISGKGRTDVAASDMLYGNDLTFSAAVE